MKINWDKLRQEFFEECTIETPKENYLKKVNMSPHNLFEWFKNKLTPKTRSLSQNNALHLWLTQIAELLNEKGEIRYNEMGLPSIYTMELLKNDYWKPLQKQLFDIESTREMTSTILNNLIDSFVLWLAEKKGIEAPPFPNKQQLLFELDRKFYRY